MKSQCPPPSRSGSLDSEDLKDCDIIEGFPLELCAMLYKNNCSGNSPTCAYFLEQNVIFLKDINNGIL